MAKGLIFSGCSYTYGAGIEREYPGTTSTDFIPQHYFIKNCTYEQLDFIHQNRFSKLVADKFETFDLNNGRNGGDIDYGLGEIEKHFSIEGQSSDTIAAIVFQITNLDRGISYVYSEKQKETLQFGLQQHQMDEEAVVQIVSELEEEYGSFEKVVEMAHTDKLNRLADSLKQYEEMGIPVFIIHWRDGHPQMYHSKYDKYGDLVSKNEWLAERRIPITYNNITKNSFVEHYIANPELVVNSNIHASQFDDHATILGHKVLAESIYAYIKDKINI